MPFQFTAQRSEIATGAAIDIPLVVPRDPSEFSIFRRRMNDSPLEVNKNKTGIKIIDDKDDTSQSPLDTRSRGSSRSNRDRRDTERSHDSDSNMSNSQDIIPVQNGPGLGPPNTWGGMMGMGYSMVGMNMIMDPNMISMNNYGLMPQTIAPDPNMIPADPALLMNPVKEIIHCKSCTLFPPNPNAPLPTTRDRPPGCRTVFVGGLPENMTEDIITEIFERCGEITTLRLSKKNFCHLRFVYEASVDAAIFLSGYRVRIGSNADSANTGRLHVDYAQARDDQYEWECRQRQLQREQRHRERMEEERLRPPSPPPVVHYTDHEATAVSEKIKQDDTFAKAVQEIKNIQIEESVNKKDDDEMDVSDDDEPTKKRPRTDTIIEERNFLKDENDSLRCQMEAYKNEVDVIKIDYKKDMEEKERQFKMLQQTLQGMQQQVLDAKRKQSDEETKVKELQAKLKQECRSKLLLEKEIINLDDSENEQCDSVSMTGSSSENVQSFNECDAKLVGIISTFLNVHPFGAGLDYIWSYVSKIETSLRPSEIETLMNKFPSVFKQELVGIGANIERRWIFNAFNSVVSNKS